MIQRAPLLQTPYDSVIISPRQIQVWCRELLRVQTCLNRSRDATRKGAVYTAHAPRHIVTNDEPHGVADCLYLKLAAISKSVGANLSCNIRGQRGTLILG